MPAIWSALSAPSMPASPHCSTGRTFRTRPEHTDAAISALQESGLRSVFAYGTPNLDMAAWWHESSLKHPLTSSVSPRSTSRRPISCLTLALAPRGPEFTTFDVVEARLGSRPRGGYPHQRARRSRRGRKARQAGRNGEGWSTGSGYYLHPLLHAQRRGAADDCRYRRHGLDRGAGGDADGPRHAAGSALPRSRPSAESQRGRRDHGLERSVRADAIGAHAAAGADQRAAARGEENLPASPHEPRRDGVRDDRRRARRPGSSARSAR